MMRFALLMLVPLLLTLGQAKADPPYQPEKDKTKVPRQPYERYFTTDKYGRRITFYLSEVRKEAHTLPLVVYVQGSGAGSHFVRRNGSVVVQNGHILVQQAGEGRARTLIVEKPGVQYLDDPQDGQSRAGSPEFRREHTLERWTEAVEAAIRASWKLPEIDGKRTLVIGHSEGGLVACRVAREMPQVTHVACLAGGGPTQLYDLLSLARKGLFFREVSEDPGARTQYVLDQWQAIQADPQSTDKLFFGFAYRRWSTFLKSSPLQELTDCRAKIYLAQGLDDTAVDYTSCDALYAQLIAQGKTVVYDRLEGANHSFQRKGEQSDGFEREMRRIVDWYLQEKNPPSP